MRATTCRRSLRAWAETHPYAASAAIIAGITAAGLPTRPYLQPANIDIVYMLAVLVSALQWGGKPALFTAVTSGIVFDFCFVPPYFSFAITDLAYLVTVLGFVVVAIATSTLAARARALGLEQAARATAEARSQAKDDILNKISHELRGPLTSVLGWIQLLEHARDDPGRIGRGLSGLRNSSELLARLVDDLLNASRITSGKFVVTLRAGQLAPIVDNAVGLMTPSAHSKHVSLESTIHDVGYALLDEHRITQIVTNLVSNAIKFTPAGGCVSVRLGRVGHQIELVVSDNGVGIAMEFIPRVFDAFAQAGRDNADGGLGLGLAIVKHLVSAHRGTIDVSSLGDGRGTTFTVRLPVMPVNTERRENGESLPEWKLTPTAERIQLGEQEVSDVHGA